MERARVERDRAPHGTAPRHREVRRALAPARRSASILAPGTRPAMAPTPLERVTVDETRLRRSTAPPAATGRSDVIRRQITDEEWGQRIAPRLHHGGTVIVRFKGKVLQLEPGESDQLPKARVVGAAKARQLKSDEVNRLKAEGHLLPEHLREGEPSYTPTVSSGGTFEVTSFEGERLSFVHHTVSTSGDDPHLTIENAHVLAFKDLFEGDERDVRDKAPLKKPDINAQLRTQYQVAEVDNLNFYKLPSTGKKGPKHKRTGKQTPHEQLPLANYLTFIVRALEAGGAPVEYGERIQALAGRMASDKKLDTSELFLRPDMDERAFIRAVLVIDSVLPNDRKLPIPDDVRRIFAHWWSLEGNEEPVPYLPASTDEDAPLVREGSLEFRKAQSTYLTTYFPVFVDAVNQFIERR